MLPGEKVESGGLALPDLCTALVRCLSPAVWVEESADDGGEEKKSEDSRMGLEDSGKTEKAGSGSRDFSGSDSIWRDYLCSPHAPGH